MHTFFTVALGLLRLPAISMTREARYFSRYPVREVCYTGVWDGSFWRWESMSTSFLISVVLQRYILFEMSCSLDSYR